MSDTTPSMQSPAPPAEKPTVAIEPPPAWAIALAEKVNNGFERVNSDMAVVKTRQELHAAQMQDMGGHIGRLDDRVSKLEGRTETNSLRVKTTTENDVKHDAAIGLLVADVANLKESHKALTATQATQLAILQRLDKVAANPLVRRVAYAVGTAVLGYLAAKGYLR